MSYWFDTVLVNSVQTNPETVITNPLDFPIIGCQVAVNNAFALDVDPEGFSTTQLFCDSFSLKGTEEALGKKNVWFSRKPSRGATRWINWYRNFLIMVCPDPPGLRVVFLRCGKWHFLYFLKISILQTRSQIQITSTGILEAYITSFRKRMRTASN
jgi:hypothetical protein